MELKVVSTDADCTSIKTVGRIAPETSLADNEPLAKMAGPEVYGRCVLLDLSDSDFISSNGVGWLLMCHKRCSDAGGKLVVHSMPKLVQNVLKVLKLEQVLVLARDEVEARRLAHEERP
ncbi:MAG TPA: STAS domain-containing protein [Pirellulales bacterium]|nr:STAS domain-containing protein [Pirellulales bacterium]